MGGYEAVDIGPCAADIGAYEFQPGESVTTFSEWVFDAGLSADEAGAEDTPPNDGIANLVKYAAGIAPNTPATLAEIYSIESADGETLTVNYTMASNTYGLDVYIESSVVDLEEWFAEEGAFLVSSDASGDVYELSLTAESDRLFARLVVENTN